MSVFIGQAFNAVVNPPVNYALIGAAAIGIVVSQVVRAVLQLGRNFGSEVIGQRLERDTRHELYASLIGKSMTFHDQQIGGRRDGARHQRRARSQPDAQPRRQPGRRLVHVSGDAARHRADACIRR